MSPKRAIALQRELASRIIREGDVESPRFLAGVDLAFDREDHCIAGVVVWDYKDREVVEQRVVRQPCRFPYIPGLLSFREAPAILAVLRKLRCQPDVFMFDGQGYAHPRRFGLACHVGLLIDRPSLGCAKSVLVGKYPELGNQKGATSAMTHVEETIGIALRSRVSVKPVYISVGHRLSLEAAVRITLQACTKCRLPEPTRRADRLVAQAKKEMANDE